MSVRHLSGMQYDSIELEHEVGTPMSEVLRELADWLEDSGNEIGVLTALTTQCDAEDWEIFRTSLVWSVA